MKFALVYISVCLFGFLFAFCSATEDGEDCRRLAFEKEVPGSVLVGHVFKSLGTVTENSCTVNCFIENDCVSFNLGPLIDGKHLCELSDSDHELHPGDLQPKQGFIYQPTKNACRSGSCPSNAICQNGFTDKGFRCVCKAGFHGDICDQVDFNPNVNVFPEVLSAEEEKHVTITCSAIGQPKPVITWTKPQGGLPSSRTIIREGNLTILNVTTNDSGSYECTATNTAGTSSSSVELQVYSALKFTIKPPSSVLVYPGQTLNVSCSAPSSLQPKVSWMYNGSSLLPEGVLGNISETLVIVSADRHHAGNYTCIVPNSRSSIQASFSVIVKIAETCSEVKTNVSDVSDDYIIDPDGEEGLAPFNVYCDMTDKGGVGVTVVSHDSEDRTRVKGFDEPGSYIRDVNYVGSSSSQLKKLAEVSSNCEQFIKYECKGSALSSALPKAYGWWVSRDGQKMTYWGRATHGCECGMTNSCADPLKSCNCNINDDTWREDSGLFTNKSHLPVIQLRFGDTGDRSEGAYHTLGKFKCYGMN